MWKTEAVLKLTVLKKAKRSIYTNITNSRRNKSARIIRNPKRKTKGRKGSRKNKYLYRRLNDRD